MIADAATFDLANAPALPADRQAADAVQRTEAFRQNQGRLVLETARDVAGVTIESHFRWRTINPGDGSYAIVVVDARLRPSPEFPAAFEGSSGWPTRNARR